MSTGRRLAFCFLCLLPFLAVALAGARPLRGVPAYQGIGAVVFVAALVSAWMLGARQIAIGTGVPRLLAAAGVLLLAPWLLIALTWVGIGAPFQASDGENHDRYLLLAVNSVLVAGGFMVLRDALHEHGERFYSSLGFAAAVPAGIAYLFCVCITLAATAVAIQGDRTPVLAIVSHLYDALEFFACLLTYVATALFVTAMARAGVVGPGFARTVVALCVVIAVLLVLRGVEYPEISGQTAPWYTQPAVIVRIPAIPWILPGLSSVALLRHAGGLREGR